MSQKCLCSPACARGLGPPPSPSLPKLSSPSLHDAILPMTISRSSCPYTPRSRPRPCFLHFARARARTCPGPSRRCMVAHLLSQPTTSSPVLPAHAQSRAPSPRVSPGRPPAVPMLLPPLVQRPCAGLHDTRAAPPVCHRPSPDRHFAIAPGRASPVRTALCPTAQRRPATKSDARCAGEALAAAAMTRVMSAFYVRLMSLRHLSATGAGARNAAGCPRACFLWRG